MKKILSVILSISLIGNSAFATNTTPSNKKTNITSKTKVLAGLGALGAAGLTTLAIILAQKHHDQKAPSEDKPLEGTHAVKSKVRQAKPTSSCNHQVETVPVPHVNTGNHQDEAAQAEPTNSGNCQDEAAWAEPTNSGNRQAKAEMWEPEDPSKKQIPILWHQPARVYKVAVVGRDIVDGKPVEQSPGFNKTTIDTLCSVGSKLEEFDGFEVLNDKEIKIGNQKLPRTSIFYHNMCDDVFCFYDLTNGLYDPDIINECLFVIFPYALDCDEEIKTVVKERMIRLGKFATQYNPKCDLAFYGVADTRPDMAYTQSTMRVAYDPVQKIVAPKVAQSSNAFFLFRDEAEKKVKRFLNYYAHASTLREMDYREWCHKSIPTIKKELGMKPVFQPETKI